MIVFHSELAGANAFTGRRRKALRRLAGGILGAGALCLQTLPPLAADPREPLALRWRTPLTGSGRTPTAAPALAAGRVFLATSSIAAYDGGSGTLLWSQPVARYIPRGIVADGGHVYVAESSIYSLAAATGEAAWVFHPAANASLGIPALDQGTLYAGTAEHGLYAIDAATGKERWAADVDAGAPFPSVVRGVTRSGDVVYVAAEKWLTANGAASSGLLAAFAAADGRQIWKTEAARGPARQGFSTPPVVAGRCLLVGDALANALTAFDKTSGKILWRFAGKPGYVGFGAAPAVRGDAVLAASGDGEVYALSLATGALLWRATTGGSNSAQALCRDLLVVSYQRLAVLDAGTGALLGRDLLGNSHEIISSGIASAEDGVVMSGPTALYSFRCNSQL